MRLVPIDLGIAKAFIAQHHRHSRPPVGWKWGVGLVNGGPELVGVGIAGRPVNKTLDDGKTIEFTRVCTLGERNANSMLYGALLRASKALGYARAYTYTLEHESGASLLAVGFVRDGIVKPRAWDTPSRPRYETDLFGSRRPPEEPRVRWVKQLYDIQGDNA